MSMHVIFRGYRIITNGFKAQCSPQKSSLSRRWSTPTVAIVRIQPRRPTLDDVQRLSEGKAAKSRGFGSRQIPHRLNVEERAAYNIAQQKGFLTLKGSGYRRERKGSPLANIYRQLSDAMNRPCVIVMQQNGQSGLDIVLVDFSPLRLLDFTELEAAARSVARGFPADAVEHDKISSPFTVIVPEEILLGDRVSQAAAGQEAEASLVESKGLDPWVEHTLYSPIWQQPPRLLGYSCDRPTSKALSKALIDCFACMDC